jgi:hypothetical protein
MNLLTFLGTAEYKETTYILEGQGYTTRYCPAAAAHFCRPEAVLVVVTRDAQAKHFEALANEISSFTRPIAVPIPDGHSEADLWQIFEVLTQQVNQGDELVVDITNGFRSLPFLSFLAVAFLRLARRVKVQRIYYGAWEARNEANESPIFDLTPFVTLLDWTIATDRFTRFGDASDLAALLREGMPTIPLLSSDKQAQQLGWALRQSAQAMETVSLALRLARPIETMTASKNLVETLGRAGLSAAQQARPFELLVEQVSQTYDSLALADPLKPAHWQDNLKIQLNLVKSYLDKGQIIQAVTLAREWLVSLLVYRFQPDSPVDHKAIREPVEFALGNAAEQLRPQTEARVPRETPYNPLLQALPEYEEIGQLWHELTQLRNDLAHVGMRLHPLKADQLRKSALALYPRLHQLGNILGLNVF